MSQGIAVALAAAQVIHLQPDDVVVVRVPASNMITAVLGAAVQEAFAPRRVFVLGPEVGIETTGRCPHCYATRE
jgi:hypothetical protein